MGALKNYTSTPVLQTEQADARQVLNNAGGYTFTVEDKTRLERFLILGVDGGTYYVGERKLTKDNVQFLQDLLQRDPELYLATVREVSLEGRAYKNGPAIFAVALALTEGNDVARQGAKELAPKVARTGTMIYELADFIEDLGGWGRAKRSAIAKWFEEKTADQLALQAVKYRQRNGWTMRDLMRLSHPKGVDVNVGRFILSGDVPEGSPKALEGYAVANSEQEPTAKHVLKTLGAYPMLPWEALPTEVLKDPEVWKKLFYNGQLKGQALVRNITRLSRNGAFKDMKFAADYAAKLTDVEMIRKTRLHPIQYLLALNTHENGQTKRDNGALSGYSLYSFARREKDWNTVPVIVDALNEGFHLAFKSLEPANKRTLIGLDVSGSMGSLANGIDLSCAQVAAAMAMVTARTEPWYQVMGFAGTFKDLGITPKMDLNAVMRKTSGMTFGSTNCSLPMEWALKNNIEVDTFAVYTDNETYAGRQHPHTALKKYRQKMGIDAKLVVVGAASTPFTIADPTDRGMLDVVGFDTAAPNVIADFSAGRI